MGGRGSSSGISAKGENSSKKEVNERFRIYSTHTQLSTASNLKPGDSINQKTINENGERLKPKKWNYDTGMKGEIHTSVTVTDVKKTAKTVTVKGFFDNGKGGTRQVKTTYKKDELVGISK